MRDIGILELRVAEKGKGSRSTAQQHRKKPTRMKGSPHLIKQTKELAFDGVPPNSPSAKEVKNGKTAESGVESKGRSKKLL